MAASDELSGATGRAGDARISRARGARREADAARDRLPIQLIAARSDAPARRCRHRSIERQRTRSPPIDEMNIRNTRSSTGLMSAAPLAGARDRSPRTALAHARGPSTTKWQGEEEAGVAARPRHARGGI
ncbi:hypothetical protein ABWH74_006094, partial [Burkholderia vietnamiensis]